MDIVVLKTSDGLELAGDLVTPGGGAAMVVLCHPHPAYGGTRRDRVVTTAFDALVAAGHGALRFDFRDGAGDAVAERTDLLAAVELAAARAPDHPIHVVGYSFGALVAAGTDDHRIASRVLIAPPLTADVPIEPPDGPVLVLTPEHDQFCGPEQVAAATAGWPTVDRRVVPMADHFLTGARTTVSDTLLAWLRAHPPT